MTNIDTVSFFRPYLNKRITKFNYVISIKQEKQKTGKNMLLHNNET